MTAVTIKNRHILGTFIAVSVAIGTQFYALQNNVLVLSSSSQVQTAHAYEKVQTHAPQDRSETERVVRAYFEDIPIMAEVAWCESHFVQTDPVTGSVKRGHINSADLGVMQINEQYHGKTAARLGLDLHTLNGNLAYARFLYTQEGLRPWSASKPCWGPKSLAMQ
jgi:hypothetical protein